MPVRKTIGLDISDRQIELVCIARNGGKKHISGHAKTPLPVGVVWDGRIEDPEQLAAALDKVFSQADIHKQDGQVVFGLPSAQSYMHVFSVPAHHADDIGLIVKNHVPHVVPVPKEDLHVAYQVSPEEDGEHTVRVVAASKKHLASWQDFFQQQGLSVRAFDVANLAGYRDVYATDNAHTVCMADIGAADTRLHYFDKTGLLSVELLPIGGDDVARALADKKNSDAHKHETVKNFVRHLTSKIHSSIASVEKRCKKPVKEVVCHGHGLEQLGLLHMMDGKMKWPIRVGGSRLSIAQLRDMSYMNAVGLAIRPTKRWLTHDPYLPLLSDGEVARYRSPEQMKKVHDAAAIAVALSLGVIAFTLLRIYQFLQI